MCQKLHPIMVGGGPAAGAFRPRLRMAGSPPD
jgi:hypothetical protein